MTINNKNEPSIIKKYCYQILDSLQEQPKGFNELHYDLRISSATLSKKINTLKDDDLILTNENNQFTISTKGLKFMDFLDMNIMKKK